MYRHHVYREHERHGVFGGRPTLLASAVLAVVCWASSVAVAQTADPEGPSARGLNDSLATAVPVGELPFSSRLAVLGWIDSTDENDVDFYRFDVTTVGFPIYLDLDLADDLLTNEDIDEGLDAAVWIFNASGQLIATNDDSDFFAPEIDNEGTDPGSDDLADRDAFIGPLSLSAGSYFVAVTWYAKDARALSQTGLSFLGLGSSGNLVTGALSDSTFQPSSCTSPSDPAQQCSGRYLLDIRTTFVPEPTRALSIALGVAGLLALARSRRHGIVRAHPA